MTYGKRMCELRQQHFNSHAHVERDYCSGVIFPLSAISTHTLTWSVTHNIEKRGFSINISTHTLTWSVTGSRLAIQFDIAISTHTLTWSVTLDPNNVTLVKQISTHTLTWSVTIRKVRRQQAR